ncbi:hypothetical protein [Klebsiella pneumoniae]
MVWRRLRIAADTSLAALHFIFQIGEPAEFGKNRTLRFSGHP